MIINNNISSMRSQGALFANNRALGGDLQKLSTGLRINNSKDDAAGLAISEGLRAQIRGQEQARRNTLDGISALNIVDGAANEIHNILQRIRELAVQGANATYSSTERGYIAKEMTELSNEIDRIISVTKFNGITLLYEPEDADADDAPVTFKGKYLQVDANETDDDRIDMDYRLFTNGLKIDEDDDDADYIIDHEADQSDWSSFISTIDDQITALNEMRADVGVLVNRLEHTVTNLTTSITNQQAAESQLRDLDFAHASSKFTRNQILTQSATAMLTQANASTQGVLSLIR